MRILLVEDDAGLRDGVRRALEQSGYSVDTVANGLDADSALELFTFDAVVLDIGLPGMDGLQLLRRLRDRRCLVPVLVLTARDTLPDMVSGLDAGADDYLTKPFELAELEARLRALIRRYRLQTRQEMTHGEIRYNPTTRRVFVRDEPLDLSGKELTALEVLLQHTGQVLTKSQIVDMVYGFEESVSPNAIEVLIHRLRKKLEPYGFKMKTIRGLGYLLEEAA